MKQIAGRVDQSYRFLPRENRRQASRRLRIWHLFNRVGSLQGLTEEETQSCCGVPDCARIQLSFGEQIHLICADLLRPELIRRTMKVLGEGLHNLQVALHGSLRVSPTLKISQQLCP